MKKIRTIISVLLVVTFLAVMFPVYVNAAPMMGTNPDLKAFHGKWVSDRWVPEGYFIHQTMKIRCDIETNYCKLELIAEASRSCTLTNEGIPTDALLEGEDFVDVTDHILELDVDAYCLTKPPTYSTTVPVFFAYNSNDDTLTDNLDTIWHRK